MTNSQKILDLLRQHPEGLDDDEISEIADISPRQQVYQICTRLEAAGQIRRASVEKPGKRKKIHNFLTQPGPEDSTSVSVSASSGEWQPRLKALIAATGKSEDEILDEALRDLAFKVLQAEMGQ